MMPELVKIMLAQKVLNHYNAGTKSLESLSDSGIPACTVDCMSAEIFNGNDALENGIISVCNQLAKEKSIKEKMTVKEAIVLLNK